MPVIAMFMLMRGEYLDSKTCREAADKILQTICLEDGMWRMWTWCVYYGVRFFADPAADPADKRPIEFALNGCQP